MTFLRLVELLTALLVGSMIGRTFLNANSTTSEVFSIFCLAGVAGVCISIMFRGFELMDRKDDDK